jgi:hypothetical protein
MNILSAVVLGLALLVVIMTINATFNHKYDYSRSASEAILPQPDVNISDIKNLKGSIVSLQNNDTSIPAWIVSGKWKINVNSTNMTADNNPEDLKFTCTLSMTDINGISSHKHRFTDFKLTKIDFDKRNSTIDGTITLVTSEDKQGIIDKSLANIPVEIKIINLRTVMVDIDKELVKHHFGNTPIYGKID